LILGLDASGKVTQTGSGFFISNDGRVVTNWHVVQNTHSIQAKTEDGAIYNVEGFLAWSASLDLAVLKAQAKRVPYLELETAATPDAGARIAVIGSPLALEGTLSEGIVSALRSDDTGRWLQITAPISPGSSGSPVLDTTGHVVGVATLNSSGRNQSLNFARSSQDLADLLKGIASDKRPESLKEIALSREREVESDPDFLLAMQALEKLDYTTALKHLNIARRRYPESPTLRVHIGGTYCGLELYDDAVQILRTVVSDVPTDEYAWMTMALALGQLGHGPEAIKASKQAVKLAPDNADAWERLGHCQVIVKDWTAAKTAFERAAKLAPRNPDYLLTLSYILAITGDAAGSKRAKEAARLATEARRKPSPTPSPGAEPTVPSSTDPSADSVTPSADTTKVYRVEGLPKSTPFLNVRSGPGAKYKILGKLTPGTSPIRCGPGRVANGDTIWQEIINPAHGWVNAQYLKPLE
jgi:tetratricopeptide (TPR) repeat protein